MGKEKEKGGREEGVIILNAAAFSNDWNGVVYLRAAFIRRRRLFKDGLQRRQN